ncbi:FUSC family protein [Streptomyces sp. RB6PN25]|uniref:FUSC family protein n=1 Tax=Streptomyces humicola TaxID=2953240 RepID=A0ABT1Q4N8_9ACTN|nr:FUSC family protein [Streptomyces humicola]MCQ4084889.1 FUSC family protein [Streptomyces humicola]
MPRTSPRHRRTDARPLHSLRRALPLRGVLRMRPAADMWHKRALSAVVALGVPEATLLAVGHLELAFYTSAGGLCALYAHGLPYAARARALAWVVAGMLASTGVALTTAAVVGPTAARVAVIALLTAAHKVICDATRIGPPAGVVLTFASAGAAFVPQHLGEMPCHLALVLAGGALAWLVCMAPALLRPRGPERIAVARALEAVARLLRAPADSSHSPAGRRRHEAVAAVNAAWHTLFLVPAGSATRSAELDGLMRLLVRSESFASVPGLYGTVDADALTGFARDLRKGRPLPVMAGDAAEDVEITGAGIERAVRCRADQEQAGGVRSVRRAFTPGSPLLPTGARVAVGSALAGWVSMALGVERPYWAVVTAAAVFAANTALSWHRSLQRVLGNLIGVLLFTALLPVTASGEAALVGVVLACQVATEATIARNYWVASVFITPMALVMTEFAGPQSAEALVAGRWLDTCLGAAAGLLACFVVPNRRAAGHVEAALGRLGAAAARARLALAGPALPGGECGRSAARERLVRALLELRETVGTAAGEWWSAALPEERITAAERSAHRLLADLGPHTAAVAPRPTTAGAPP